MPRSATIAITRRSLAEALRSVATRVRDLVDDSGEDVDQIRIDSEDLAAEIAAIVARLEEG